MTRTRIQVDKQSMKRITVSEIVKKKEQYQRSPDYRVLALLEATCQRMVHKNDIKQSKNVTLTFVSHVVQNRNNGVKNVCTCRQSCDENIEEDLLGLDSFFKELKHYKSSK